MRRRAIAHCHSRGDFRGQRRWMSLDEIVDGTVGVLERLTLEERVCEAFEADKKAFARRVREELLPQRCVEAGTQCCVVCYRKHLKEQLSVVHPVLRRLRAPKRAASPTFEDAMAAGAAAAASPVNEPARTRKRARTEKGVQVSQEAWSIVTSRLAESPRDMANVAAASRASARAVRSGPREVAQAFAKRDLEIRALKAAVSTLKVEKRERDKAINKRDECVRREGGPRVV